ncbi:MAG: hypothetical protein ACJ8AW_19315, partial [Rhodopila sp.]
FPISGGAVSGTQGYFFGPLMISIIKSCEGWVTAQPTPWEKTLLYQWPMRRMQYLCRSNDIL